MIEDQIQRHSRIQTVLDGVKERYEELNKTVPTHKPVGSLDSLSSEDQNQHEFLNEDITKFIQKVNGSESSLDFEEEDAIIEFQKRLARHNDKTRLMEEEDE